MENEMISIIVPVHNAANYIEETVRMVCRQTYTDWELILVDDASTDGSADVVRRVMLELSESERAKIRLICMDHNIKAAAARNLGLDAASGRYIAFLDADDVWLPHKLERELAFVKEGDIAFAFTAYEFGDEEARPTGKIVHVPPVLDFRHALSRTVIFTSTTMFDTRKIDKKLIYMPQIESEDTATWWTILKTGLVANGLDEPLTIYRRPAKSLSSNKFVAMRRIWQLYRRIAGLGVISSAFYFIGWAYRATKRRI